MGRKGSNYGAIPWTIIMLFIVNELQDAINRGYVTRGNYSPARGIYSPLRRKSRHRFVSMFPPNEANAAREKASGKFVFLY